MSFKFLHKLSAERTDPENLGFSYFFYQHQKVYSFCKKFIRGKKVLEVGSGSGYGTKKLSKNAKSIIAIDKDKISINKSKNVYKSVNIDFIYCKVENYFSKDRFDVIISLQVIEHLKDPKILLEKLHHLIKEDGLFIFSTPNRLTQSYNENPYHYKEYSSKELSNLLSNYFREITFYGLYGDKIVTKQEKIRKEYVLSFLNRDKLKLRKFIPRKFRQFFFDIASFLSREIINRKNRNITNISEKNFRIIKEKTTKSIDIIIICKNIKI